MVFIAAHPTQIFHLFVYLAFLISAIKAGYITATPSFQLRDVPAECSNPPSGSCTFYADCLESRYHCGTSGYPIGYGEHYCEAFTAAKSSFSAQGQEWLTNTMQCLQASLVPEATGEDDTTCSALSDKAFGTHATCYVSNGLCSLPATDWGEIVKVVGWAVLNWETIMSAFQAAAQCENLGAWILLCSTSNSCPETA